MDNQDAKGEALQNLELYLGGGYMTTPALIKASQRALKLLRLLKVRQVVEAGPDAIEAAGLNPWCINEGMATGDEEISTWWLEDAIEEAKAAPLVVSDVEE